MCNILVIEDNIIQRKALVRILDKIMVEHNIKILEADSRATAIEALREHSIGLLFVDIELRDGSGLELVKELRRDKEYEFTPVVFVTSHEDFILQAFKSTHCYDYILKPYEEGEIQEVTFKLLNSPMIEKKKKMFLRFSVEGVYIKILIDDIFFIESLNKDCVVHTKYGRYNIKRISLKNILKDIKGSSLVQCHRSYIVNTKLISSIDTRGRIWTINFNSYNEAAYVGITFRKFIKKSICTQ